MPPSLEVLLKQLEKQNVGYEARLGKWGTREVEIISKFRVKLSHLVLGPTENLMVAEWNEIYAVGPTTEAAIHNLKLRMAGGIETYLLREEGKSEH